MQSSSVKPSFRLQQIPSTFWILVVLTAAFSFLAPGFATHDNVLNIARQGAVLTITAVGMMVAIASAGIDLSVGALIGLSGTVIAVSIRSGVSWPMAAAAGIAACAVCGLVSGLVVAKARIYPFVATLGMLYMSQSISLGITQGGSIHIDNEGFAAIGHSQFAGLPISLWITLVMVLLVALLMRRTVFGRYVFAIGHDAVGASWMGIKVDLYKVLVYLLSSIMAGVAGVVLASRVVTGNALVGQGTEFDAIAAVVIGGTSLAGGNGSVLGTVIGALVIAILRNGLSLLGLASEVTSAITGVTLMLAVILAQAVYRGGSRAKH